MPLVSDIIPSLAGGVSQQPASMRVPGKAAVGLNVNPSLFHGTDKRPPTELIGQLIDYDPGETPNATLPLVRFINRDEENRYMVWMQDSLVRVFDLSDGSEQTVTMAADSGDYIDTANPRRDLELLTVGDTTFVHNRAITVANGSDTSAAAVHEALIYVKNGAYGRKYSITINGTEYYYNTPSGAASWNTPAVDPAFIAYTLVNGFDAPPANSPLPANWFTAYDLASVFCDTSASNLEDLGGTFTVTLRDSIIRIACTSAFDITVEDGQGGAGMSLAYNVVSKISDLPSKAFDGFLVRVGKSDVASETDYYLQFNDADDDGTGEWAEVIGPGVNLGVDPATMPHRLVNNGDGTWDFEQVPYEVRACGTDVSCPDPTFVGRSVNAMRYEFDRLAILSGEDVHYSAARDLYRFYRASTATKAEDDPFAITAAADGVSILRHSVSLSGASVFFAAQRQFQLERTSERFAALGAQLLETTAYEALTSCAPEQAGDSIFFAAERGNYATIREYRPQSATTATVSDEVGVDIPRFIPAGVYVLAASTTEQALAVLSAPEQSIYVYRWTDIDGRRLMSAWSEWTVDDNFNIVGADFIGSKLYLALDRPTFGVYLEVIDLSPQPLDTDSTFKVRLDGLVYGSDLAAISYNSTTDRSTVTLGFDPTGIPLTLVYRPSDDYPQLLEATEVSRTTTTLVVEGDLTDLTYFVGRPYTFRFRFSPFFVRENVDQRGGAVQRDGRLQIADLAVEVVPPYYMVATVTNEGRTPWTSTFMAFTSEILDDETLTNENKAAFVRFKVAAQNTRTIIELTNDTHLPCQLLSAQWRGQFNPRSRSV